MVMFNDCEQEEIEGWIAAALEDLDLKNYTIKITGTTEKGDGYVGHICFAHVVATTKNNVEKEYDFAIKHGKKSSELRKSIPVRKAFEQEITIYNRWFPLLNKFQEEKNIAEPFNNNVKCFKTLTLDDMEVLVFQNMKKIGYELYDRKKPFNLGHIKAMMREYGKHHALSYALKDQKPEEFNKITYSLYDVFADFLTDDIVNNIIQLYKDSWKILEDNNEMEILEKYKQLENEVKEILFARGQDIHPKSVIIHGDCWINNFMFHYKGDNKSTPSKIAIIDWQVARMANPVYDLSYYLYSNASGKELEHFDDIMRVYYDSLSEFMRQLGSDPDKIFTFEDLMDSWKKYSRYGLIMCLMLLKFILCDKEEAPDMVEFVESGKDFAELIDFEIKDKTIYNSRVLDVIRHYMNSTST